MKRLLFAICYWAVALPVLSLIILGFGYSFAQSLLLSTTILPSVLIVKYLGREINGGNRFKNAAKAILLICLVLVVNYFGIYLIHLYFELWPAQEIIQNPVFLLMVTCFFTGVNVLAENAICHRKIQQDKYINFVSDRHSVQLEINSIKIIESNDDEVWVHTAGGHSYRTKMPISAWENVLDDRFLRVHRSFIVNKSHVTEVSASHIMLGDNVVEVSRKYRDKVAKYLVGQK